MADGTSPLGKYDSPESRAEYVRIVALLAAVPGASIVAPPATAAADATVNEIPVEFLKHAESHYRHPDGRDLGRRRAEVAPVGAHIRPANSGGTFDRSENTGPSHRGQTNPGSLTSPARTGRGETIIRAAVGGNGTDGRCMFDLVGCGARPGNGPGGSVGGYSQPLSRSDRAASRCLHGFPRP